MRSHRPKLLLLLPLVAALSGCWDKRPTSTALTVDRTSPVLSDPSRPVLLNDALTVYFSEPIQPRSVNEDSVVLMDENGHTVRGEVEVGTDWIAFVPAAPLAKDLGDGSFQPGGHYRLHLGGQPRFSRIRAEGGGSLSETTSFDVYVAKRDEAPDGLPAILRPLASDLPLMLRETDVPQHVASDAPRLQMHFTLPVLPTSLSSQAFRIRLYNPGAILLPRSIRVVKSPLDDHHGSTIEIDLGAVPQTRDGRQVRLKEGDFISVELLPGNGLLDYAGQVPLPAKSAQFWSVVEGRSLPICEWPLGGEAYVDDALQVGFEVRGSMIRPRVRIEAGNGNLGVFRPKSNMTLRPGVVFDRGDGQQVASTGADFHFAAIDVPAGVEVTIDAQDGPVRLLAAGGIRIAGSLRLLGSPTALLPRYTQYPVAELIDAARVALVAAGDIQVGGEIKSEMAVAETQSVLLLATAGSLRLRGGLPFQTILVPDTEELGTAGPAGSASRIEGVRGQTLLYQGRFTPGVARGGDFDVAGMLPWRQLPAHLDSGTLEIGGLIGDLSIVWQATAADPIRGDHPDMSPGRVGRWQPARDRDVLMVGAGRFVRLKLSTRVRHGEPLPSVDELRLVEN